MSVSFLAEAEAELDEAVRWYEARSPGLGARFARAVLEGVERIDQNPRAWPEFGPRTRRCRLGRFPYCLVYAIVPQSGVGIIAVMRLRQRPGYWRDRKTSP